MGGGRCTHKTNFPRQVKTLNLLFWFNFSVFSFVSAFELIFFCFYSTWASIGDSTLDDGLYAIDFRLTKIRTRAKFTLNTFTFTNTHSYRRHGRAHTYVRTHTYERSLRFGFIGSWVLRRCRWTYTSNTIARTSVRFQLWIGEGFSCGRVPCTCEWIAAQRVCTCVFWSCEVFDSFVAVHCVRFEIRKGKLVWNGSEADPFWMALVHTFNGQLQRISYRKLWRFSSPQTSRDGVVRCCSIVRCEHVCHHRTLLYIVYKRNS